MTRLPLAGLALALGCASAFADTTAVSISQSSWADLGAGPLSISAAGGPVAYRTGATPSAGATGTGIAAGAGAVTVATTSHIWAKAISPVATTVLVDAAGGLDINSAPFSGDVPMTVGVTYPAQRSVGVLATVAGNVSFQFADASTITLPVFVGWQTFPFAVTQIASATATATYFNLK